MQERQAESGPVDADREAKRLEAERVEAARAEAERAEAGRLEAERVEAARAEAERVESERSARQRLTLKDAAAAVSSAERLEPLVLHLFSLYTGDLNGPFGAQAVSVVAESLAQFQGLPPWVYTNPKWGPRMDKGMGFVDRAISTLGTFDKEGHLRAWFNRVKQAIADARELRAPSAILRRAHQLYRSEILGQREQGRALFYSFSRNQFGLQEKKRRLAMPEYDKLLGHIIGQTARGLSTCRVCFDAIFVNLELMTTKEAIDQAIQDDCKHRFYMGEYPEVSKVSELIGRASADVQALALLVNAGPRRKPLNHLIAFLNVADYLRLMLSDLGDHAARMNRLEDCENCRHIDRSLQATSYSLEHQVLRMATHALACWPGRRDLPKNSPYRHGLVQALHLLWERAKQLLRDIKSYLYGWLADLVQVHTRLCRTIAFLIVRWA